MARKRIRTARPLLIATTSLSLSFGCSAGEIIGEERPVGNLMAPQSTEVCVELLPEGYGTVTINQSTPNEEGCLEVYDNKARVEVTPPNGEVQVEEVKLEGSERKTIRMTSVTPPPVGNLMAPQPVPQETPKKETEPVKAEPVKEKAIKRPPVGNLMAPTPVKKPTPDEKKPDNP
jgi:hypothetical protein